MKIMLDLKHSFNNYYWNDKQELNDYINYMKQVVNDLYSKLEETEDENITENDIDRLYDMFDMFSKYEIIGDDE